MHATRAYLAQGPPTKTRLLSFYVAHTSLLVGPRWIRPWCTQPSRYFEQLRSSWSCQPRGPTFLQRGHRLLGSCCKHARQKLWRQGNNFGRCSTMSNLSAQMLHWHSIWKEIWFDDFCALRGRPHIRRPEGAVSDPLNNMKSHFALLEQEWIRISPFKNMLKIVLKHSHVCRVVLKALRRKKCWCCWKISFSAKKKGTKFFIMSSTVYKT